MQEQTTRRRKKLIKPRLQLKLIGAFGGIAMLAMMLQFLMTGFLLTSAVLKLENGGEIAAQLPGTLLLVLLLTSAVLVPLFLVLGVMLTFRFAGPVYRFEQYLQALARGEQMGPCKLRQGDYLQSLCDSINLATEPLRASAHEDSSSAPAATIRDAA